MRQVASERLIDERRTPSPRWRTSRGRASRLSRTRQGRADQTRPQCRLDRQAVAEIGNNRRTTEKIGEPKPLIHRSIDSRDAIPSASLQKNPSRQSKPVTSSLSRAGESPSGGASSQFSTIPHTADSPRRVRSSSPLAKGVDDSPGRSGCRLSPQATGSAARDTGRSRPDR